MKTNSKFPIDINLGYKKFKEFSKNSQWYLVETEVFISNISFILKIENGSLVSFNGENYFQMIKKRSFNSFRCQEH